MKTLLLFVAIALSINVFGQDIKTIKIDKLEVMTEDLVEMKWDEATKACANLGDGWRLPTKDELNILYENKDKIGGFVEGGYYWGSEHTSISAWAGMKYRFALDWDKQESLYVRLVRSIN